MSNSNLPIAVFLVLMMILSVQIRAARALLGMSQTDLARRAEIGVATVKRIELAGDEPRGGAKSYLRIQTALEADGIIFISADEKGGPGVRLRTRPEDGKGD